MPRKTTLLEPKLFTEKEKCDIMLMNYVKQIRLTKEEMEYLRKKENSSEFIRLLIHREMENESNNRTSDDNVVRDLN